MKYPISAKETIQNAQEDNVEKAVRLVAAGINSAYRDGRQGVRKDFWNTLGAKGALTLEYIQKNGQLDENTLALIEYVGNLYREAWEQGEREAAK